MKNICIIICISTGCCFAKQNDSLLQNSKIVKNEICISYGLFAFNSIFTGYRLSGSDLPYDYVVNKNNYQRNIKEIPPLFGGFNFGYKRYIKNKFVPLLNITYTQINSEFNNKISDTLSFKSKDYSIAILPGFEYHYLQKPLIQLYSGLQLGLYINKQKLIENKQEISNTKTWFAFQVDIIGISVGKRISGFIELGFGFTGIIKTGISAKF